MIHCLSYNNLKGKARELQLIYTQDGDWIYKVIDPLQDTVIRRSDVVFTSLYKMLSTLVIEDEDFLVAHAGFHLVDYFMEGRHKFNDERKVNPYVNNR